MNQLSWLLYFADLFGGLGQALFILVILSAIIIVIGLFASMVTEGEAWPWVSKRLPPFVVTFVLCLLLSSALPSKETVYAIAASEMGEEVLNSPVVGKVGKALESWLDKQLAAPAKGETANEG